MTYEYIGTISFISATALIWFPFRVYDFEYMYTNTMCINRFSNTSSSQWLSLSLPPQKYHENSSCLNLITSNIKFNYSPLCVFLTFTHSHYIKRYGCRCCQYNKQSAKAPMGKEHIVLLFRACFWPTNEIQQQWNQVFVSFVLCTSGWIICRAYAKDCHDNRNMKRK